MDLPHRGPALWDDRTKPIKSHNKRVFEVSRKLQDELDDAFTDENRVNTQQELDAFQAEFQRKVEEAAERFQSDSERYTQEFAKIAESHGWYKVPPRDDGQAAEWDGPDPLRRAKK